MISWNFGTVPFGTCNERFRVNGSGSPGPGAYEHNKVQLTKPIALKGTKVIPKTSPGGKTRKQDMSMTMVPGGSVERNAESQSAAHSAMRSSFV